MASKIRLIKSDDTDIRAMFKKPSHTPLSHLLTIDSLSSDVIHALIDSAESFNKSQQATIANPLSNKIVANLFFEPSTRTQYAFEIAAKKLQATVITPAIQNLSTLKGESLLDTIHNFEAMGTSLFIVRHAVNHTPEFIASELSSSAKVINAGDGTHQHPSQCLIDLMTIRQHFPDFAQLSIAILGDLFRSRVTRSLDAGLKMLGTTDIRYITPPELVPDNQDTDHPYCSHTLETGLKDCDVVYCLRVQKERMLKQADINEDNYFQQYSLTADRLKLAKPNAIVMHPGPINRGFEIESIVADSPHSVIIKQAQNSIPMRMAILNTLLS